MVRRIYSMVLIMLMLVAALSCQRASRPGITQDELVRRTQELVDAVAPGDQAPWNKHFAEDAMFFDERGEDMNKKELVAGITPLPEGYSGTIKVANAKSHIQRDVAILSYDLDETEIVYGQTQKARYHETDTWMPRWAVANCRRTGAPLLRRPGTRRGRSARVRGLCRDV